MIALGLIILIIFLVIVGQPLFVIVGSISAYCFHFFAEEEIQVIIGDIFYAGDKEILL
ncbi:MAG: TRAP transporter large permease, partial [Bdellovibrionales bacterium]|nr:TRAP transporter large permease [Bdellovibrionales bacterium]